MLIEVHCDENYLLISNTAMNNACGRTLNENVNKHKKINKNAISLSGFGSVYVIFADSR